MELKKRIQQDLNSALKEKRELEVSVLRQLLAAILNKEKEKRYRIFKEKSKEKTENLVEEDKSSSTPFAAAWVTDEEVIEVISSEAKKRREAIELYVRGSRPELAEKEKKELEILQRYLPEQLSEEEIKKLAKEAINKTGAKEIKDMGRAMAELMPKVKGRADGSLVGKIVKELLS